MFLLGAVTALALFLPHPGSASSAMVMFEKFVQQFRKSYSSPEEFRHRLSVFTRNMAECARLQREERGTAEYGVTQFSDLTAEEFRDYGINFDAEPDVSSLRQVTPAAPFPDSQDWRRRGIISEVKNQGRCRSCWAFAAVGNIEAQWGIEGCHKNLSVQDIIDCGPCDRGCVGGYPWDAYNTVQKQGGLANEFQYPYDGVRKECRRDLPRTANIRDVVILPSNETAMASYVGNNGTLTVIINSVLLQNYVKGVIHHLHKNCDPTIHDHVVLIVGYRNAKHLPYWTVKNSYGNDWGEKGYFRIFLGQNVCGITKYPVSATVSEPRPPQSPPPQQPCPRSPPPQQEDLSNPVCSD